MTETTLAAAILAGGDARRLGGVNKGTLVVGGAAIADRQLAAIRPVTSRIFVVGRPSEVWASRGLEVIPDDLPGAGPLGGIYTAVTRSPCERTLVLACDLPFVSAELLARLAAEAGDVVVPRSRRGLEPLCAIYSRACAPDIRARIARGELEASTLPRGMRVVEVAAGSAADGDPGARLFENVNTPHDYERAKGLVD